MNTPTINRSHLLSLQARASVLALAESDPTRADRRYDDAHDLLNDVIEKGEPFAVVLGTGGPHIEIRGGTRHDGTGYQIHGYWAGEHSTWSSEGVGRTGEYFREMVEDE